MSDTLITTDGINLEVKPVEPVVPEVVVKAEEAVVSAVATVIPAAVPVAVKEDIEKIVKDVLKAAIKELLEEMKKSPLAALDKDGDGKVSVEEIKEAAVAQAAKLGCAGPSCTIS
jgi:hypothetical protein